MILQVVSYDFPLHGPLQEYFLYVAPAPPPPRNLEGVANQEGYLRCSKRFDHRSHCNKFCHCSSLSQLMMLALGNQIREMLTMHTNPHAVQGRFTPKDDCERQFWNGPFRELKERINDLLKWPYSFF